MARQHTQLRPETGETATETTSRERLDQVAGSKRGHLSRLNDVEIPRCRSFSRRSRCRMDLRRFCLTYGKAAFPLPFSADHDKAIAKLQEAVTTGGRFALAMPRGSGKTTLVIWTLLWALCYGHRKYVVLIACDIDAAKQILEAVKGQVDANPLLFADFPGLCAPVRAIEGIPQRAPRMHVGDHMLDMVWSTKRIVCPNTQGAASAGVKLEAYGLDGRLRGAFVQRAGGEIERPDLAVLDDPQKDKHAKSKMEVDKRERIIRGTVLGLAGPGRRIAAVCPCTVIERDDLADRLLDSTRNPEWQSLRTKLVYRWPAAQDTLWAEYAQRRREAQVSGDPTASEAATFYTANREAMDLGSVVGWEHRMHEGETSAIQHAENLLLDVGEAAFAAEYQNDPQSTRMAPYVLTSRHVLATLNGHAPRVCPVRTAFVVGAIDINRYGLHWVVAAARMDRCLWVLDYGKYPPGAARLYVGDGTDNGTEEQVIRRGLDVLGEAMTVGRRYLNAEGNTARRFDLLLVDCGYQDKPVYDFAAFCRLPVRVMPARGFGARNYRPTAAKGRAGDQWHESETPGKGRFLAFNADHWRAASQRAWLQPIGAGGSISLFGNSPASHAEFAEQCSREKLLGIEARGTYDHYVWDEQGHEWHDLGDCVTGVHVAASHCGADPVTGGRTWGQRRRVLPRRESKIKPE